MAKSKSSSRSGSQTPARRGIQKPRARTFRYSENSKPTSRIPRDDRTLNRQGPQVEIVRPKWASATPTTARILPMFCAEDPNGPFDPTRLTCNAFDFSDWSRGLPAAKYVGIDQKITFITHDPRRVVSEGYDARKENPYNVLYNAIQDAVKEGEAFIGGRDVLTGKWAALTVDGPKKAFNSPTKLYFMQGLLFEHDGENFVRGGKQPKGTRKDDLPIIIEVSKTAGEDLAKQLNTVREDYMGDTDPDKQAEMYELGDLVDLKNGSFVTFYNPDKHEAPEDFDEDDGGTEAASAEDDSGDSREFKSWKVAVTKGFHYTNKRKNYTASADISQYEDVIRERLLWWEDILYIPTHEELCLWLAQAFRSMPDLLRFGWSDNPEFFTDEVNAVLSNRTQGAGVEIPTDDEAEEEKPSRSSRNRSRTSAAIPDDDDRDETEEPLDETSISDEEDALEQAAQAAEARSSGRGGDSGKKKRRKKKSSGRRSRTPTKDSE